MTRFFLLSVLCAAAFAIIPTGCQSNVTVHRSEVLTCPEAAPSEGMSCSSLGASCDYQAGACVEHWECVEPPGAPLGRPGETRAVWHRSATDCGAVPCNQAAEGDACSNVGDSCSIYGDCEGTDKLCGDDRRWHVNTWYDECCYDGCCDPFYCPRQLPEQGSYCDPCFDSDSCAVVHENECGDIVETVFRCDWETATWLIEEPPPCTM